MSGILEERPGHGRDSRAIIPHHWIGLREHPTKENLNLCMQGGMFDGGIAMVFLPSLPSGRG